MSKRPHLPVPGRGRAERRRNERLKAYRHKKNWTQVYVATMIGTSDVEVSRWETGTAEPTLYFREKLCELFGATPEALGFVTTVATKQEENASPTFPWNLPYRRNPFFTGRDEVLARLHTLLRAGKATALMQTQAISGLGGIGKTQTAIEYAYRYHADYSAVLWVKADTRASLFADIAALARTLNLPEQEIQEQEQGVAAVLRWLRDHANWLLILDNVEDLALTEPVLSLKTGHVLLTTCTQITGTFANQIDLQKMSVEEGALFLLRRAKRLIPDAPLAQASDAERNCAEEIARLLDGLPLALDQAGAYIEETACSLADYLDRYRVRGSDLLSRRGSLATDHPEPVSTTLSLSFEKVARTNPAAADLLRFCAFLDPDTIPQEFLTAETTELEWISRDPLALDEVLATLRTYSLVRRIPATRTWTIHRLVQAVLRESMPAQEQRRWAERVVRTIATIVPSSDEVTERTEWERGRRYYLQVLTAVSLIENWQLRSNEAEYLLHWAGAYLNALGQYPEAEALLLAALKLGKELWEAENPLLGEHTNDLALVYLRRGDYAQAEHLLRTALRIQTRTSGVESRNGAIYLNNLASLYLNQGNCKQAEPLLLQACHIQEKLFGPDDPDLAFTLTNLAWLSCHQGNLARAEAFQQRALRIREQQLGARHFWVAHCLKNLGIGYREQADYPRAESFLQQALQICQETAGAGHPLAGQILHELACLRCYQGQYEKSASLFDRALTTLERRLRPEHPEVLAARNGYATLLMKTHRFEEARAFYEQTLERSQRGDNKIHLAAALEGLARVIATAGEPHQATRLWGVAASLREELGVPMLPHDRADYEYALSNARAQLDEKTFTAAWDEGRGMTPEQVLVSPETPLASSHQPDTPQKTQPQRERMLSDDSFTWM